MKKNKKTNVPLAKPNESNTFGGSKGLASPRRKSFAAPGSATKDMRHGVNEKKHNLKGK